MTRSFLILLLMALVNTAMAQIDPHFSQYYAYPLWLNPALTGVVDGEARLTGNYRDQWTGVEGGYKTTALSGDYRQSDKLSLGANLINQKAGTAGYSYLAAYGSVAYQVPVSANSYHKLNMGLQAGIISRSFDAGRLRMDEQYNPATGFDAGLPLSENFSSTGTTAFDAGAGVFYYDGTPGAKLNAFGGLSIAHLAGGKDPFATNALNSKVPMRFNLHGGIRIDGAFIGLTPHFIYIRQENSEVKALGMNAEFNVQSGYSLMIGGMYRLNDAAIGNVAFYAKNMIIGLSYDYTTSALQNISKPGGTFELSLSYVFKRRLAGREEKCPRL